MTCESTEQRESESPDAASAETGGDLTTRPRKRRIALKVSGAILAILLASAAVLMIAHLREAAKVQELLRQLKTGRFQPAAAGVQAGAGRIDSDVTGSRKACIEALARFKSRSAIRRMVIAAGAETNSPAFRRDVFLVLQSIGEDAVPHLADSLSAEPSWIDKVIAMVRRETPTDTVWARRFAAGALGEMGYTSAIPFLIERLNDVDSVADAAMVALAWIGPAAIEPLKTALKSSDARVRWFAAGALWWIERPETIELRVPLLDDPDAKVRRSASLHLSQWRHVKLTDKFIALSISDADQGVLDNARRFLTNCPDLPERRAAIESGAESSLEAYAANDGARAEDLRTAEWFASLLESERVADRLGGVGGLGQLVWKGVDVRRHLVAALSDEASRVRLKALQMLGLTPEMEILEYVTPLLSDPDELVAVEAVRLVARIRPPNRTDLVMVSLKHPVPEVRKVALWCLPRYEKEVEAAILTALEDPDISVRREAARRLASLGGYWSLKHLERLESDDDTIVRRHAGDGISSRFIQ